MPYHLAQGRESRTTTVAAPTSARTLLRGGAALSAAGALAGAGNYATNTLLARRLDAEAFGDAALVVTLMLAVMAVAGAIQLVIAARTTDAGRTPERLDRLARRDRRRAWIGGGTVALALAAMAPVLSGFLNTENWWVLAAVAPGIPLQLALAVDRGRLQGTMRFAALSRTFIVEMVARLTITWLALEVRADADAAAFGVVMSLAVTLAAVRLERPGRVDLLPTYDGRAHGPADVRLSGTITLLGAGMLLANADLVVVKATFSPEAAGSYAAVALVGRALVFCGTAIANVVFPICAREPDTPATTLVVRRAVGALATAGAALVIGASLFGDHLVRLLFADGYPAAGALLPPFLVGTTMLVVVHLLATTRLAAGAVDHARLMLGAAVVQIALLAAVSSSLQAVVWTRSIVLLVLLVLVARRRGATTTPEVLR